jgi:hypothetical protein
MSVLDPIDAVSSVNQKNKIAPSAVIHGGKQSDFLYKVNYVIAVMELTQVCMKHQEELVSIRSKLAEITTKIQSDLNVINQYMTTLQNKAAVSDGEATYDSDSGTNDPGHFGNTDYTNGFGPTGNNTWYVDPSTGKEVVDAGYQSSTQAFVKAFTDLYYGSPFGRTASVSVQDLMQMDNPENPNQPFDMSAFWGKIAPGFNTTEQGTSGQGLGLGVHDPQDPDYDRLVISTRPTDCPSLIQQYIYYQAKLNLYSADPSTVKAASADFTKIPGMNFDPREDGFDPNINQMMSVITALNTKVSVNGGQDAGGDLYGKAQAVVNGTSKDTLLRLIVLSSYHGASYLEGDHGSTTIHDFEQGNLSAPTDDVGLYGVGSFLAYNYFWTKDPQAKDNGNVWSPQGSNHRVDGDLLSDIYSKTSSTQASLSSASSAQGTNFQQDTSGMTTENNEVQQMISSFMQGQGSVVGNFKGA